MLTRRAFLAASLLLCAVAPLSAQKQEVTLELDPERGVAFSAKKAVRTVPLSRDGVQMDSSTWPIVHGSVQSRDNSDVIQPTSNNLQVFTSQTISDDDASPLFGAKLMLGAMKAKESGTFDTMAQQAAALIDFNLADANPVSIITQKINEREQLLWTSTIGNVLVYRQRDGQPELEKVATYDRGLNFRFHGSYAFVASAAGKSGFYTTVDDAVVRFELTGSEATGYEIVETGKVAIPAEFNQAQNDHLVGVTVLADGTVAATSKYAVVMAIGAKAGTGQLFLKDAMSLPSLLKTDSFQVSNSISSDGEGIYIVTQREMVRVDFAPEENKLLFRWSTIYGGVMPWMVGRLGPGSGSTPTVTTCEGQTYVTITDGGLPMNIMFFDTETGKMVGNKKVQFARDENGNLPTTSEQSVAVDGCKAFVVQNYMGGDSLLPDVSCASIPPAQTNVRAKLPNFCDSLNFNNGTDLFTVKSCPSVFGCFSKGAAVFELQPSKVQANGMMGVQRVWTRDDVSCGTSIPLISTNPASNLAYCVGLGIDSDQWALLGMDMKTGKSLVSFEFFDKNGARNFFANPFYAGVEAVGDNKMVIGSVGGIVYLSPGAGKSVNNKAFGKRIATFAETYLALPPEVTQHQMFLPIVVALVVSVAILLAALVFFKRPWASPSPRIPR